LSDIPDPLPQWLLDRGLDVTPRPVRLSVRPDCVLKLTLPMVLAEFLSECPQPTLVQVGAYDGASGDPLEPFLRRNCVRAVLLEPQPGPFATLQQRYASRAEVLTLQLALADHDGTISLYVVEGHDDRDPWWTRQIASWDRDHLLKHKDWVPDLATRIREVSVESICPGTLLRRHNLRGIDVLVVDAEGADWTIASLFLDAGIVPGVIAFEWRHLERPVLVQAVDRLAALGYQMEFVDADLIGRHRGLPPRT